MIFARTSGKQGEANGITCFVVPTDTPGFNVDFMWYTFNMPSEHAEVTLDNVRVSGPDCILGGEGKGLEMANMFVHENRIRQAASGVGGTCTAYDNTATITETEQSASKSVDLCVAEDPTVTKTAAGTFDRTYRWELSKEVDRTLVEQIGGTATFRYTVEVEQEGVTDSGWVVTGVITVVNPNDWQAITLTGLVDAVDNGGSCTVDDGPWVVPASGSLTVAYRCSYSTRPAYSGTNTATATWDRGAATTPDRKSTRLNSSHT